MSRRRSLRVVCCLLLADVCQLLVDGAWFLDDCCCVLFGVVWRLFVDMRKSFSRCYVLVDVVRCLMFDVCCCLLVVGCCLFVVY